MASGKRKKIHGLSIFYQDIGDGKPLFCMPPWPFSSAVFAPMSNLIKDHTRIIAPDLPGFIGRSQKPKELLSGQDYFNIATEFINSFDFDEYDLLGFSFGGLLAQAIIAESAVHPNKLVLVSSLYRGDAITEEPVFKRAFEEYHEYRGNKDSLLFKLRFFFGFTTLRKEAPIGFNRPDLQFRIFSEFFNSDIRSMVNAWDTILGQEFLSENVRATDPLVIYGEEDLDFVKRDMTEVAEFTNKKPIVLPNAEHRHLFLQPDDSVPYIVEYLSS